MAYLAFSQLDESAKQRARQAWREAGNHDEWWANIYLDAVECASRLGIRISTTAEKSRNGVTREDPMIYFTLHTQGAGACFGGSYVNRPDAVAVITEHAPQDAELKAIAEELTMLQLTAKMKYGSEVEATINANSSYYSHSDSMQIDARFTEEQNGDDTTPADLDGELIALIRRFADWIYKQLEEEDEYLNSDEYIDEQLAERLFDEDGFII